MKSCGSSRVWMWKSAFRSMSLPERRTSSLTHVLERPDAVPHRQPERRPAEAESESAAERHPELVAHGERDVAEAMRERERGRPGEDRDHREDVDHGQDHDGEAG